MIKLSIFLQGLVQTPAVADTDLAETTLWDLIKAGDWIMIPIGILSIAAIYIFIERFLTIRKATKLSSGFFDDVKNHVVNGNIDDAKSLCLAEDSPTSRMILKGISRIGSPMESIVASVENTGKIEINKMEKNLTALATISGAAPMIGFLGTVIGMIKVFISLSHGGSGGGAPDMSQLSGGIYEALVTTVAGLIVGIIAYIAYNYLTSLIQKVIHRMEYYSVEFVELLQAPNH